MKQSSWKPRESRFAEPDLHATLLSRHSYDNVVIDHERVTRNFPEGPGTIEMLCIYLIEQGLIARASFKLFNKLLAPSDLPLPPQCTNAAFERHLFEHVTAQELMALVLRRSGTQAG